MQIDEATYSKMPERLQRLFDKLPNPGSAEVLAGFPVTTSGKIEAHHKQSKLYGRNSFNESVTIGIGARGFADTGSAARFFYCAKASKQDRDEGCEGLEGKHIGHYAQDEWSRQNMGQTPDAKREPVRNFHPTVKPTSLMRYLCRLVTPQNGVILDPFMGSGSTGKAAVLEGFNFIGIDTELEYVEIAARRIEHACEKVGIVVEQPMMFETQREPPSRPVQLRML